MTCGIPPLDVERHYSYGGVLFDGRGRVLLRKTAGGYDGYVWTFAKGGLHDGETPEETALREVLEETGYEGEIVGRVPGEFEGSTGWNIYFLMRPSRLRGSFKRGETSEIVWVALDEAGSFIEQTPNLTGRKRDLEVLRAATAEYVRLGAALFAR